jgi:hypothetical protein
MTIFLEFWPLGLKKVSNIDPTELLYFFHELDYSIYCFKEKNLVKISSNSFPNFTKDVTNSSDEYTDILISNVINI